MNRIPFTRKLLFFTIFLIGILSVVFFVFDINKYILFSVSIFCIVSMSWYIIRKLSYLSYIIKSIDKVKCEDYEIKVKGTGSFSNLAKGINDIKKIALDAGNDKLKIEIFGDQLLRVLGEEFMVPVSSLKEYLDKSREVTEIKKVNLDLKDIVKSVLKDYEKDLEKADIDIKTTLCNEKAYVNVDEQNTKLVIKILLENIKKYSLKNTKSTIDVYTDDKYVYLTTKNIANKKYSTDNEEHPQGLGISISEKLIRIQDGNLDVYTESGLFKVTIKLSKEKDKPNNLFKRP